MTAAVGGTRGEIREQVLERRGEALIYDAARLTDADQLHLDAEAWSDRISGSAQGRAAALFIDDAALGSLVLRHYHRGGLPARLSQDRFVYRGLQATRPWREWRLLREAWMAGLPVPRPLAGRVRRAVFSYTADILMDRIPDAESLADLLAEQRAADWPALGRCLAEVHAAGFWHADLNARNLLHNHQGWHVIDWDRGERRAPGGWGQDNLDRLRRSLDKLRAAGELDYAGADWQALLTAYAAARS